MPLHAGVSFQYGVRRHERIVFERDIPQEQAAALHARVLDIDGIADADVVAELQQFGRAHRHRADHDIVANLRAQEAEPPGVQRRPGQQIGGRRIDQAVSQPPAIVRDAPQGVGARLEPPRHEPFAANGQHELHDRRQQEHADRRRNGPRDAVARLTGQVVISEERRQPLRHAQRHQQRKDRQLGQAAQPALRCRRRGPVGLHRRRSRALIEAGRNRANLALLVDVAHRHVGKARILAQGACQAGSKERVTAQVGEEILLAPDRLAREQLGKGREQGGLPRCFRRVRCRQVARQRRAQCHCLEGLAVDFS